MATTVSCNPCCSTATAVQLVGPAGTDATALAPGVVDPEGVVTGNPGQTYSNTANNSFWVKYTGNGNTGWHCLIGPDA